MTLNERALEKTTPANIEAERAVLGALLIDTKPCRSPPFSSRPTSTVSEQPIYNARLDLHERREPGDSVTLVDELNRRGQLDRVGGPAY